MESNEPLSNIVQTLRNENEELKKEITDLKTSMDQVYSNRNAVYLLAAALAPFHPSFEKVGLRESSIKEDPNWPVLFMKFEDQPEISYHMKSEEVSGADLDIIEQPFVPYSGEENLERVRSLIPRLFERARRSD